MLQEQYIISSERNYIQQQWYNQIQANMFTLGAIIRQPSTSQITNQEKIVVIYSGKYSIQVISKSRVLPEKLLLAKVTQEIPPTKLSWNLRLYKTENGQFMKGGTPDNEFSKTQRLGHIFSQDCGKSLRSVCGRIICT